MAAATIGAGLDDLDAKLRRAPAPSASLVHEIVRVCPRLALLIQCGNARDIERLARAGAWTDLAFALVRLGLPRWQVRRIACEDGEWHCALSQQPNVPLPFDDAAEAQHAVLPLAMLRAFVDALRMSAPGRPERPVPVSVPRVGQEPASPICCDDFS